MGSVLINGYKGSVYPERDRESGKILHYSGVLDLGFHPDGRRNRPKRKGRTRAAVEAKLTELADELRQGIKTSREHTVLKAVSEYVDELERQGRAPNTIRTLRGYVRNHVARIGHVKVRDLRARDVDVWITTVSESVSHDVLRRIHGLLTSALDRAIVMEWVDRNVSAAVGNPHGEDSGTRESKSFTPGQVAAILATCTAPVVSVSVSVSVAVLRFGACTVLALTTGLRTDELTGLRWDALDLDKGTVSVVRANRHKGKTKTKASVRTLSLGDIAVRALRVWQQTQAAEYAAMGMEVTEQTHVFTREPGIAYTTEAAREAFRRVLRAAGIGDADAWTLRESRTTFVSIMSHNGIAREVIADMCGHTVRTLEKHYRKVLAPVHRQSAQVINTVFGPAA